MSERNYVITDIEGNEKDDVVIIPSDLNALVHACVQYTYNQFKNNLITIKLDDENVKEKDFETLLEITKQYVK